MKKSKEYENNDTIQFFDSITKKLVLEIGTNNYDDYYPCCIMSFYIENLSINVNRKEYTQSWREEKLMY